VSGDNPARAQIVNLDQRGATPIPCFFNPKELSLTKSNTWKQADKKGSSIPPTEFGGGQPATMTMELLFDTYAQGGKDAADVRAAFTDAIWNLMMVPPTKKDKKNKMGRPPRVQFQWGKILSFEAVITSITQKFTLFNSDGTPVRATLNVTFQQIVDATERPRQNPTSGGVGGERVRTVQDGDTLAWIAYEEYGDPTRRRWDANRLTRVRHLTPGLQLEIPNG